MGTWRVSWELEGSHGNLKESHGSLVICLTRVSWDMSWRVSWELEGSHGNLVRVSWELEKSHEKTL